MRVLYYNILYDGTAHAESMTETRVDTVRDSLRQYALLYRPCSY